jgi:acyl carrier protein
MSAFSPEQILDDLAGILRNFHGRQYRRPITPQTRFVADLGLASIDAVVLGETLEEHYGRKLPFGEFMADLGRRGVKDVELEELIRFLHRELNK